MLEPWAELANAFGVIGADIHASRYPEPHGELQVLINRAI